MVDIVLICTSCFWVWLKPALANSSTSSAFSLFFLVLLHLLKRWPSHHQALGFVSRPLDNLYSPDDLSLSSSDDTLYNDTMYRCLLHPLFPTCRKWHIHWWCQCSMVQNVVCVERNPFHVYEHPQYYNRNKNVVTVQITFQLYSAVL